MLKVGMRKAKVKLLMGLICGQSKKQKLEQIQKKQKPNGAFLFIIDVIIKYNNMATRTKTLTNKAQFKKRTLRSSQRHSPQYNNTTGCSSQEKVIDQIKKQIEHQQSINASKSMQPVLQQPQALQQLQPGKKLPIKNDRQVQPSKNKCLILQHHVLGQGSPQISNQSRQDSLRGEMQVKQKQQKHQASLTTPPSKSLVCNFRNTQNTPYKEERKSYRKFEKSNVRSVPYRRCQDQFQQKIVTLMNKICYKKNNDKEVENFSEKVQKISFKDLYNPYVVSGIQTILNLLEKTHQINVTSLGKLKSQVKNLSQKIWLQLGKTDQYEKVIIQQKRVDMEITKPRMMKRIYRMLVQSKKVGFQTARQKSFQICQQFFNKCSHHVKEDDILTFIKDSKFLQF